MRQSGLPASKAELIAASRAEYDAFVALVEQIPAEKRLLPLVGDLSLKDIVAHMADWERWMLHRLRSAAAGEFLPPRAVFEGLSSGGELVQADLDAVNHMIFERFKDADWHVVWHDFVRTHDESLQEIAQLSESDLFDPQRAMAVAGLREGTVMEMVAGNVTEHYREHADEVRAAFGLESAGK